MHWGRLFWLPFLVGIASAADWPVYLGDKGAGQYSALDQITPGNVARLEVAWTYHCGDAEKNNLSQIQCNPLVIDGVLYATTPGSRTSSPDPSSSRRP